MPCCLGLFCPSLKMTKFLWMAPSNWTGQNLHRSEQATCTSQNWDCLCSLSMLLRDLSLSYGHQWTHYVSNTECQYFGLKKKNVKVGQLLFCFPKMPCLFSASTCLFPFSWTVFSPESTQGRLSGLDTSWWRKDFPRGFSTCLDFLHCPAPLTHPASTALLAALRKTKRTMAQSFLEACHLSKVHVLRKYWTFTKNWCFFTVVLKKTLESSLESKEIKQVNPKGNQAWILNGRIDAESPIVWPPDTKSQLIGKDPVAGKDWGKWRGQ